MNRTITLRLGTLLTIAGVLSGAFGGWLVRRDVQVITQVEVQARLDAIDKRLADVGNEVDFARAYLGSLREWAIRVSATQGWPEPRPTGSFLPQSKIIRPPDSLLFSTAYAGEREPVTERPTP